MKLPKIYRFFPAKVWMVIFSLLYIITLTGIIMGSFTLYRDIRQKEDIDSQRKKITLQTEYWQGIVSKYKGYRDGYFQLAVLNYNLGDTPKSALYLQKSLELDPNFPEARKLGFFLGL